VGKRKAAICVYQGNDVAKPVQTNIFIIIIIIIVMMMMTMMMIIIVIIIIISPSGRSGACMEASPDV